MACIGSSGPARPPWFKDAALPLQGAEAYCGGLQHSLLHCALSFAAQCIVIGTVCVFATSGRALFEGLLPQ